MHAAHRRARARRCCAARVRVPGSAGLAHALSTFRANARRDASQRSALADRGRATTHRRTHCRLGAALAAETLNAAAVPWRLARMPQSRRSQGLAAMPKAGSPPSTGTRRRLAAVPCEELSESPAAKRACGRARRLRRTVSCRDRRAAWCASPGCTTRACAFWGRSKRVCSMSTASCWAGWTRAPGRRKPAADPWLSRPMRQRPRPRSARAAHRPLRARFRAGAAAPSEVILSRAAKVAGAPTVPRASCSGSPRSPVSPLEGCARSAASTISRWRARSIGPARASASSARAETAARRAAGPASLGHRYRELAARSLYDLRQACAAPAAARSGRHAARRARPRHRHPRRHRRVHREIRGAACRPIRSKSCSRSASKHFARARRLPGGARVLVAALRAHRALVCANGSRAPRRHHALHAEIRGEIEFRSASATSRLAARADRIEQLATTAATPSSTTRPARRAPRNRCASGLSPQLTLEAAILRGAASDRSPQAVSSQISST